MLVTTTKLLHTMFILELCCATFYSMFVSCFIVVVVRAASIAALIAYTDLPKYERRHLLELRREFPIIFNFVFSHIRRCTLWLAFWIWEQSFLFHTRSQHLDRYSSMWSEIVCTCFTYCGIFFVVVYVSFAIAPIVCRLDSMRIKTGGKHLLIAEIGVLFRKTTKYCERNCHFCK